MKVIGDNIIVEVFKKEPQTDGGILVPENMSNLEKGKVICVGTGLEKEDLESGDIVTFNRNSGSLIEQDDRSLVKLHKDTILFFEKKAKEVSRYFFDFIPNEDPSSNITGVEEEIRIISSDKKNALIEAVNSYIEDGSVVRENIVSEYTFEETVRFFEQVLNLKIELTKEELINIK